MKNTSVLLAFVLTGLASVRTPLATEAAMLQSFDQLFIGDDEGGSFEFNLLDDPAVPTTLRFAGFLENRNVDAEGAVRFFLGWQTNSGVASDGVTSESIIFPAWPDYLHGVRLPEADAVSGPVRVPIKFQAEIGFSPSWVKLAVEGLTGGDNFHDSGSFDPAETITDSRLIGRSVWNTDWMLIIPGGTFLFDPNQGLDTFINSVGDIKIFFQTYAYSGN